VWMCVIVYLYDGRYIIQGGMTPSLTGGLSKKGGHSLPCGALNGCREFLGDTNNWRQLHAASSNEGSVLYGLEYSY